MAEINHSDSCIFPYEIRGMLDSFAMVFWKFAPGPALLLACHHSPPPRWGGIGSCTITASWLRLTDMVTTLSMEAL